MFAAETIQGRKLFKGRNYTGKYGKGFAQKNLGIFSADVSWDKVEN